MDDVKEILHMNRGDDEFTYANHSKITQLIAAATKPQVESAVTCLISSILSSPAPQYKVLRFADLGCAAGPNTFLFMKTVIDSVEKRWLPSTDLDEYDDDDRPEIQFYLNDLPGNDFNSLFRGLSSYNFGAEKKIMKNNKNKRFYAVASCGSFHDRLFPSNTMHFIYSSYSVHWLSKMPSGLIDDQGVALNKGSIYISEDSPPLVKKAYSDQFQDDFTHFLRQRSHEMVRDGIVLLIINGRLTANPVDDKGSRIMWDLISKALSRLVSQGVVDEEKLDSFNMPFYLPSKEEVTDIVEREGSFSIQRLEMLVLDALWLLPDGDHLDDDVDPIVEGKNRSNNIRAITEPLMSHHFGKEAMGPLYHELTSLYVEELNKARGGLGKYKYSSIVLVLRQRKDTGDRGGW